MAGPSAVKPVTWLVLVYQMPAKTAALNAMVRRKLNGAGAVYLSRACAVIPSAPPAERVMRRIRAMITGVGGSAVLLQAHTLSGEDDIIAALNAARDREYDDIITHCQDGATTIEAMTAGRDFRYESLWEHDARLKRLDQRHRAMQEHNMPGADRGLARRER